MESYTNISNSLIEDENLSHTEFRVMMTLIRYYNTDLGYSFPTRELLVKKCRMNKDTLGRVLNSLEEKGYITRSKREGKAGRNNIYYINKYLVGQQESLQASTKPKPNNKSRNKKKQATEVNTSLTDDEDLYYKLGFIENSVNFTGDFTEQQDLITKSEIMFIYSRGFQAGYSQDQVKNHIIKKFNKTIDKLTKKECMAIVEGYQAKILKKMEG